MTDFADFVLMSMGVGFNVALGLSQGFDMSFPAALNFGVAAYLLSLMVFVILGGRND